MTNHTNLQVELELTFLANKLPKEIYSVEPELMIDIYVPDTSVHPKLRIRRRGNKYEITKKLPLDKKDMSIQSEQTIPLTKEEFEALLNNSTKTLKKDRYSVIIDGHKTEIDVFKDELEGLVLLDFEFKNKLDKAAFKMPSCCLADVTQESFIAGGMLAGKTYKDIEKYLSRYNYPAIRLNS